MRGARESIAGTSVSGNPIVRYDFGRKGAPIVMLTGLIHGVEVVGGIALFETLRAIVSDEELLDALQFVVVPIVNPDAFDENMLRVARGVSAARRTNANGVDLNRNFALVRGARAPRHPFGGSRFRFAPHYVGPHAFSEPESMALRDVALSAMPAASIGFHSFGNLLLYPWAHTRRRNPRAHEYERIGAALENGYRVMPAASFYRTIGDMDDWLDDRCGTLAFTLEVGSLNRRVLHPRRAVNPFCWMNPTTMPELAATLDGVAPAVIRMLRAIEPCQRLN